MLAGVYAFLPAGSGSACAENKTQSDSRSWRLARVGEKSARPAQPARDRRRQARLAADSDTADSAGVCVCRREIAEIARPSAVSSPSLASPSLVPVGSGVCPREGWGLEARRGASRAVDVLCVPLHWPLTPGEMWSVLPTPRDPTRGLVNW